MDSVSQSSKILKMLRKSHKTGVPNYRFPQVGILKYSSRISELRKDGYNIVAVRQVYNGIVSNVFNYHLIEADPENTVASKKLDFERAGDQSVKIRRRSSAETFFNGIKRAASRVRKKAK